MAEEAKKQSSRERIVIKTSVIGIAANIFLSAFKAAVGLASNSIAIVLDAVNNLSDALSSVITIIGTRLAGKPADKKHPFGHGRIEYITAMIIAVIVLYAGITSLLESVKKIIHPETAEYTVTALVIVAVAVIVKLVLGRYVFTVGKKVHSDSLVAALIFIFLHISLESWLGAAISIVIIKSGFEMLSDTIAEVLGKRVEPEIAETVKRMVEETPEVRGAYDLTLHNYGPDKLIGSVHVEVDEDVPISRIDEMSREIQHRVYEKSGVAIEAVGIYAVSSHDPEALAMKKKILALIWAHDFILETHGFHVNKKEKKISVDFVADFNCPDRQALYADICREIKEAYPDYELMLQMDIDVSDGRK